MSDPTWRVRGTPLVRGGTGPLSRETVAVKDLYAVAGQRIGAGNPTWLEHAPVEQRHADAVQLLLDAGADITGIVHGDELAWSLAGANPHYGTPPNPAAPGRLPGGSSSGSASAVALGDVSVGLGTDTGGSVRLPAAYQGLCGIRTTHGAVSTRGVVPLARSFDTVGWLTRDAALLAAVGDVLLPAAPRRPLALVALPALIDVADPDVAGVVREHVRRWDARADLSTPDPGWVDAYLGLLSAEAWQEHGGWLTGRLDALGPDVRSRFEAASRRTVEENAQARVNADAARQQVRALVADRVLVFPATGSVAPLLGGDPTATRAATLQLTCLAGLGGLPSVTLPARTSAGLPCGIALLGPAGSDRDLLALAAELGVLA